MKYIKFSNFSVILFGEELNHVDVANNLEGFLGAPVSAGFATSTGTPYGTSVSLGLRHDKLDEPLIKRVLGIDPDL